MLQILEALQTLCGEAGMPRVCVSIDPVVGQAEVRFTILYNKLYECTFDLITKPFEACEAVDSAQYAIDEKGVRVYLLLKK